jgi:OTU domain-containing protein 3
MGKQKRKAGAQGGDGEFVESRDRRRNDRLIKQQFRKNRQRVQYGDQNWNRDWKKFLEQLAPLGLTIKDVAGDGNCLFRSIADQLEGDPNRYAEYRAAICNFIEQHREDYEPFIEDDQTFDKYLANMRRNTTWGGNIEIQAASLVYNINICIHQLEQPRWEISNFDGATVRTIHLSYHQGDHYASVRRMDEMKVNGAAPKSIVIGDSTKSLDFKNNDPKMKKKPITYEEKQVIDATGCQNLEFIRKVMEDNYYDTYATIEFISVIDPEGTVHKW